MRQGEREREEEISDTGEIDEWRARNFPLAP